MGSPTSSAPGGGLRGLLARAPRLEEQVPALEAALEHARTFEAAVRVQRDAVLLARSARDPEHRARLRLVQALAVQRALDSVPFERRAMPAYKAFLAEHKPELVYSEPAGSWLFRADRLWALAREAASLPCGERIAWAAARQPLPGECETDAECHVARASMTYGRYLEAFPRGRHASEALHALEEVLGQLAHDSQGVFSFPPAGAADSQLGPLLGTLRRTVAATKCPAGQQVLDLLDLVARRAARPSPRR